MTFFSNDLSGSGAAEEASVAALETTVAELAALGPRDLGATDWLTIDQKRVDQFADATDDHQWIHVDPVRTATGPFGSTIAHGYLTLSLAPRLLEQLLTISDQVRGTNYGLKPGTGRRADPPRSTAG
jgi:acyl dehydratase